MVAAAATLITSAAIAQTVCASRDVIVGGLFKKHGETIQYVGIKGQKVIVETYANEQTGSWTIVFTNTAKISCIMADGHGFDNAPPKLAENPT